MPIAIPRLEPWTRNFGPGARINREHWASRNIRHAIVGGIPFDIATGKQLTVGSLVSRSATKFGGAYRCGGGGGVNDLIQFTPFATSPTSVSFLLQQHWPTGHVDQSGWAKLDGDTLSSHWSYYNTIYTAIGTNARWINGAVAPTGHVLNEPMTFGASVRSGEQQAYWNGLSWASGSGATIALPATCEVLGDSRYPCKESILSLLLILDCFLSSTQHAALAANPWEVFR